MNKDFVHRPEYTTSGIQIALVIGVQKAKQREHLARSNNTDWLQSMYTFKQNRFTESKMWQCKCLEGMPGNCCIKSVTVINTQGKHEKRKLHFTPYNFHWCKQPSGLKTALKVYDIYNPPIVQSCV